MSVHTLIFAQDRGMSWLKPVIARKILVKPSVDDLPARQESGLESPPDFSGKSGNRG
jgi:hypothetical protein